MRTFGSKNPLFDDFLTLMTVVFNDFWGPNGPRKGRYGVINSFGGALKGLDPQNQDFDRFLMKIIKFWSKNDQKVTFWSKIQNFPGYPREKWKIDFFVVILTASFLAFFRVLHGRGSIFDFFWQIHQNHHFWWFLGQNHSKPCFWCHNP